MHPLCEATIKWICTVQQHNNTYNMPNTTHGHFHQNVPTISLKTYVFEGEYATLLFVIHVKIIFEDFGCWLIFHLQEMFPTLSNLGTRKFVLSHCKCNFLTFSKKKSCVLEGPTLLTFIFIEMVLSRNHYKNEFSIQNMRKLSFWHFFKKHGIQK